MANAMLEDSFKSSHPDLVACEESEDCDTEQKRQQQRIMKHHAKVVEDANSSLVKDLQSSSTPMPRKKSVDFRVETSTDHYHHRPPDSSGNSSSSSSSSNKRMRQSDPPWTPKQVVDALSTCISPRERLEAIQKAKDTLDHDVQSLHDEEMASGADAVLAKHLTFLVYQALHPTMQQQNMQTHPYQSQQLCQDTYIKELSLTCNAMESLYRASSPFVGASFARMGPQVLQILISVIDAEIDRRFEMATNSLDVSINSRTSARSGNDNDINNQVASRSGGGDDDDDDDTAKANTDNVNINSSNAFGEAMDSDSSTASSTRMIMKESEKTTSMTVVRVVNPDAMTPEGDTLLRMATKVVCHFARVGTNTRAMAHFPGLLGVLIRMITVQPYSTVPWEARLSALWTLANLACCAENMQLMVCTPGLVAALVQVACRAMHPGDSLETIMELLRSRANASKAILNLSWAPENKVMLADQFPVLDLLAELTLHRSAPMLSKSRTVREILATTRRHAISALRNLAAAPRRIKLSLCEYKNGHLLDVLTDAALNDPNEQVKDLAFAAIHNLAIQDTAIKIMNHPALVLALRSVLQNSNSAELDMDVDDEPTTTTSASSPRAHASATLLVLERTITPEMECYETLRDLLDAVNPAPAAATSSESDDDDDDNEMEVVNATAV